MCNGHLNAAFKGFRIWGASLSSCGTCCDRETTGACVVQGPAVYESTFVGLQGLSTLYSKGSAELEAAENALMTLLSKVAAEMKEVYDDKVLYQVCFL